MIEIDPGSFSGATTLAASVVLGLTARAGIRRFDAWIDQRRAERRHSMPSHSFSVSRR